MMKIDSSFIARCKAQSVLLLLLMIAQLGAFRAAAQGIQFPVREMSSKLYGNGITSATNVLRISNDQRATMLGSSTFGTKVKYKSNTTLVKFSIDHAAALAPRTAYTYKMAYRIEGCPSMTDSIYSFSANDTLVVSWNPDSLTAYQDIQLKAYPKLYQAKVTITQFYDITSGTPVALSMPLGNNNFFVELAMQYQPYLKTHYGAADMGLNTGSSYDAATQQLNVLWAPVTPPYIGVVTPAQYELEWTYVDNYAPDGSTLSAANLNFSFKNNATRVITDTLAYRIPVVYPKGYIVYRVRMVRVDSVLYKYPVYGNWTIGDNGRLSALGSSGVFQITAPHSGDSLNWNYTIHFAEAGKYKHVMGYFDGMLKNRQTITRFNTRPDLLLATENIYDYEGRPSITTLPAVVSSARFGYQKGVSLSSVTGLPYAPADFDVKPSLCPDEVLIPPFTNASLANRYYSRLNTDTAGMQKFVPQAEGYPFVHTQLSPGFADRVDRMSGAGSALQISKGHSVKNEYVGADQPDLNNLFGINAGIGSFYTKTVTTDPNGQNSMLVKDYRGKQVVTSLIGASVDTLRHAIMFNDEVPAASKFKEDKLAGGTNNITVGSTKTYAGSFYMDFLSSVNVIYEYDFKPYTVCPAPYLGLMVKGSYAYKVNDDCGRLKLSKSGVLGTTGVTTVANPPAASASDVVALDKGKHTIEKTLTVAEADIDAAVDSFMAYRPSCLKTENQFIKEAIDRTTYPCPAIDPCADLKKKMMEELFTGAKYGRFGGVITPSIYDIQNVPGLDPGLYRFQAPCVAAALNGLVIKRYGTTYTNIGKLPIDTFLKIYTGENRYTIARELLPLHPEFCKLAACFADTFETRFKAMPDAATAIKYNLYSLDSIVKQDIQLRSKLYLAPFMMTFADDSLKRISNGTQRMDTVAAEFAFCANGEAPIFGDAREFFHNDIVNLNLPAGNIKNGYFENLRTIYLSNRAKYKAMLQTSGRACEPCDSQIRMTLIPPPLIPVKYTPDGGMATGPDSYLGLFSDTMKAKIAEYTGGSVLYSDTSDAKVKAMRDSVRAYVAAKDSQLNSVAVDTILSRLVNCFSSPAVKARLKDTLLAMVHRGEVHNGIFLPEQVRNGLSRAAIPLTDLCHTYLVSYDYYNESMASGISCGAPAFYAAARDFLNDNDINRAIRTTTTAPATTAPAWPATNIFAARIEAALTGGSGNMLMNTVYSAPDSTYHFRFFKSGSDTLRISFLTPGKVKTLAGDFAFLTVPANGPLHFDEVSCYFDDPNAYAEGYVGKFMFRARITREDNVFGDIVASSGNLIGWNNGKVAFNDDAANKLAACIPCTQFRTAYQAFADSMSLYGAYAADHPLFYKSLRGFMNYRLKRVYTADQYKRFLISCALADSMNIPMYGGYGKITFPSGGYPNIDAFAAALETSDGIIVRAALDYTDGGSKNAIIDYRTIPYNKLSLFNTKLLAAGGYIKTSIEGLAGILLLPADADPGEIVKGTIFTGSSGIAVTVRKSPYLGGTEAYTKYEVYSSGATFAQVSAGSWIVDNNLIRTGIQGYWYPNSFATVNSDYQSSKKKQLLQYVYAMQSLPASKVLDTLQPWFITANLSSFAASDVSYADPVNPYKFTDLFYTDASNRLPAYDTVKKLFAYANNVLGGKKILLPAGTNTMSITAGLPAGHELKVYRCADGLYWYRYFGKDIKLFDIYLRMPAYVYKAAHNSFELLSFRPSTGDTMSSRFTALMKIPGTDDTVYANGSTDFDISWTSRLRDVLLGNDADYGNGEAPLSGNPGAVRNCEQNLLFNNIVEGKTNYENYITKFRDDLKVAFRSHVMNQVKEKLWIEYIDMRFGTTLYTYDRAQNLIQTIPPAGIKKIDPPVALMVDSFRKKNIVMAAAIPQPLKATRYEYNTYNKPWKENTPDAGTKVMFYDAKGNVLLSQGQQQRQASLYTYFLYDGQNRLTETGEVQWGDCPYFDPISLYYRDMGYVSANKTPRPSPCACENLVDSVWEFCDPTLNTNFYDDAAFNGRIREKPRTQVVYTVYDSAFIALESKRGMSTQENLRSRIAANMYYQACAPGLPALGYDHATHYSYDPLGNVQTLSQDFPQLEGMNQRYKRIDYEYDLLSGKVNMIAYNRAFTDQFFQRYSYDADNRLTKAETSRDGFIWKRDAEYTYYQHGPLARMSLGDQRVQGVDYAYTIQGWLKAINGDCIDTTMDMGGDGRSNNVTPKDAYASVIDYFPEDYKAIGYTPLSRLPAALKGLYNGNIARQSADIARFGELVTAYTYDQMNRIRKAVYADGSSTALAYNNKYASAYKYDLDGNIKSLVRREGTSTLMDTLVYQYPSNKNNKLANVLDYATFNVATVQDMKPYTTAGMSRMLYDLDGNVIKDLTSNTDSIRWNIYGKATNITNNIDKMNLYFGYDGLGHRQYKMRVRTTDTGSVEQSTYYVREASGNILAEYVAERELGLAGRFGVMTNLRDLLSGARVKNTWFTALSSLGYLVHPAFSAYIISTRPSAATAATGFYLANDPSLFQQFAGYGLLATMSTYSTSVQEYPVADALSIGLSTTNPENTLVTLLQPLLGNWEIPQRKRAVEQIGKTIPAIFAQIAQDNNITGTTPGDSAQLLSLAMNIAAGNPSWYTTQVSQAYTQNPATITNWLKAVSTDQVFLSSGSLQQIGFVSALESALMEYGSQAAQYRAVAKGTTKAQEGLNGFATWWSNGKTILKQLATVKQLTTIDYFADPVAYLEAITGYASADSALYRVTGWDIMATASALNISVNSDGVLRLLAPALKRQDVRLGAHHMYGSSRLGISEYLPGQYRHSWDYRSGIIDTAKIIPSPWYSRVYNEVIERDKLEPWGNGLSRAVYAQHTVGQKQYELTNQLGNVQATISDKRFPKIKTGTNNEVGYYNAVIPAAYDYYPYGQLMPGRWVRDTTPVCLTTTTTQLVPKASNVDIPVNSFTLVGGTTGFTPWRGGPVGAVYLPQGTYVMGTGGSIKKTISVTPGKTITVNINLRYLCPSGSVYVEISQTAGFGTAVIGSEAFYSVADKSITISPSASAITISVQSLATFVTAPQYGLFGIFSINYDQIDYIPQNITVQTCSKQDDKYEFGFNGQMKDNEVAGVGNSLDYGARIYNPRIARWSGRDPLANKYPFVSPYNFALNTPIQAKDPDGRIVVFINGQHAGTGGKSQYWGGFDNLVMKRIGDGRSAYYDGGIGGWKGSTLSTSGGFFSSDPMNGFASDRYKAGYAQGMADAMGIINNLARSKDGTIIESVKIISHSMGGVYAKGFASALSNVATDAANAEYLNKRDPISYPKTVEKTMKGFKIEFEVDFASFQPNSKYNNAIPGIRTIQVSHKNDFVVNGKVSLAESHETKQEGVADGDYHLDLNNKGKDHKLETFSNEINTTVPQSNQNAPKGAGGEY